MFTSPQQISIEDEDHYFCSDRRIWIITGCTFKMTEKEKLQEIIESGFQAMMILREISQNEVKNKLPEFYWDKKVFALPLIKFFEDKKLMFYMIEEETINYANELVEEAKTVIGYSPVAYCTVTSTESSKGQNILFDELIASLGEMTGWDIKKSEYPNTIEIRSNIKSGSQQFLSSYIREIEIVAMLVSLKNKKGFQISAFSQGEYTKGQPFGITWGLQQHSMKGIKKEEFERFKNILTNDLCREAISSLQLIYSQISNSSKLTICWATIEHIFDTKPNHILKKEDINEVLTLIDKTNLDKEKIDKITEIIKNPNLLSEKNRNARIAENISHTLGFDQQQIYDEIRNMTRTRGKMVHSLGNETDISYHLNFVEKILSSYISKLSGIEI